MNARPKNKQYKRHGDDTQAYNKSARLAHTDNTPRGNTRVGYALRQAAQQEEYFRNLYSEACSIYGSTSIEARSSFGQWIAASQSLAKARYAFETQS